MIGASARREPKEAAPDIDVPLVPDFGVALSDYPEDLMSAGWACLFGKSPFRYTSVGDLPNNAIWVTSYKHDYKKEGRIKHRHHLRRVDYLRANLFQIAKDFGWSIDGGDAAVNIEKLARLFHQTMHLALNCYKWRDPMNALQNASLYADIRNVLKPPKPDDALVPYLTSACQSYSSPAWPYSARTDQVFVTLRFNRLEYARKLLSQPLPSGSWSHRTCQGGERIEDFFDPARPCLIECTLEFLDTDPDLVILSAFGAEPHQRGLRRWITQVEAYWMSKIARITPTTVIECSGARPMGHAYALPAALTVDPLFSLSGAAGVLAESHLYAIWASTWHPGLQMTAVSVEGVWLRAMDRAICFSAAEQLMRAGHRVTGYGNGSISVSVARSSLVEFAQLADELQMMFPNFSVLLRENGYDPLF